MVNSRKIFIFSGAFIVLFYLCFSIYVVNNPDHLDNTKEIFNSLNANNIESISINSNSSYSAVNEEPIIITNRDSINTIIHFLKNADELFLIESHHRDNKWSKQVIIKSNKGDLNLEIDDSESFGIYIQVLAIDKIILKTIKSDSLGLYLNPPLYP